MKRYGLVFKLEDQCFLTEYNNDGSIEDASPIDDSEGIYAELNPREMSLVGIVTDGMIDAGERVTLQDLKTITIENKEDPYCTIMDLLESGYFPTLAQSIFDDEKLE